MTFHVKNLYVAAALHAHGRTLVEVTIADDGQRVFCFDDNDRQCAALEYAYNRAALPPVQPRDLFAALFAVRRLMYAAQA
jgi:hypothetical protein